MLDKDLFPSGEAYHERKNYLNKVIARTFVPMAFHMCWTDNKVRCRAMLSRGALMPSTPQRMPAPASVLVLQVNKIVYFKNTKIWYLPDNRTLCSDGRAMHKYAADAATAATGGAKKGLRDVCCQRERYWWKNATAAAVR